MLALLIGPTLYPPRAYLKNSQDVIAMRSFLTLQMNVSFEIVSLLSNFILKECVVG